MSTHTITQRLAQTAENFIREPAGEGYLVEIGAFDGLLTISAITVDGQVIATIVENNDAWLITAYARAGRGLPVLRLPSEADALTWLEHLADLHTATSAK